MMQTRQPFILEKYTCYFHDGSIIAFEHQGSDLSISIESAEVCPDDIADDLALTIADTIKGRLRLTGVRCVSISNKTVDHNLEMIADSCEILDFEIEDSKVHFFVQWVNYSKNDPSEEYTDIVIEADAISWENDPNLHAARGTQAL